jgi:23S rRNA (guanosine2251-2'-O)-methyltransferase
METYCPYPDCKIVYQAKTPEKPTLFNETCPNCKRLGRVKPLEIIDKLKAKEEKTKKAPDKDLLLAKSGQFQVLLEDIRSLWNVGSVFRTADAVNVSNLFLCGITGCPPRQEISKTALGAEEDIPWTYMYQTLDAVNLLKAAGVTILGLERNSDSVNLLKLLTEKQLQKPLCLAIGNEVAGLSPELLQSCDYVCDLPMKGKKESLNVASAFAVAAYFIDEFI